MMDTEIRDTIQRVTQRKLQMEAQVAAALSAFTEETGLRVTDITLMPVVHVESGQLTRYYVQTDIHLAWND